MEGKYAFASYSHQDADSVMPLVESLLDRGFRIWIDRMQLVPGKDWSSEISGALGDARALLWFAGRHTSTSKWMQAEARAMVSAGEDQTIIPVLVKGAEPEELPLFLRNRQWVDARSDTEQAIGQLSEALVHYLGAPAEEPTEKVRAKNKGYVFISYSVEDAGFLDDLKEFLRTKGYGYWDFHENKRDYQAQFHLELESIIRDSRAMLCIVTPSWKHSRWAPREYLFTEDIRKPIFLLRAERMEPTLLIAGSSYIDFVDDRDGAFRELDRELATAGL
ncbi:MAG: toll/interleukin-1 receptor domain-containing protein [Verrucomicrobiales bacterium]|nr:toll/interleukin-1 receptor domain-containing protein [Verrucomicrobiales bacterium]